MKKQVSWFEIRSQAYVNKISDALLMEDIFFQEQEHAFAESMFEADIAFQKQEAAIAESMMFFKYHSNMSL